MIWRLIDRLFGRPFKICGDCGGGYVCPRCRLPGEKGWD